MCISNASRILGVLALFYSVTSQANLIQNGSFEYGSFVNTSANFMRLNPGDSSLSNWNVVNQYVAWGVNAAPYSASNGVGFVDLSGFAAQSLNSSLQQSFSTVAGNQYMFSIDRQGGASNALIDGAALTLTPDTSSGSWTTYTALFTASSTNTLLSIENASPSTIVFVDNVSIISAVPVPAAVWLFGSGLLGLIGISRRKRAA